MMENVAIFDIIACALILFLGIKGIINGFIKEVFGLVGIIGGVFVASRYGETAGDFIDRMIYHIDNKASVYILGFLGVLVAFWLSCIFLGFILSKLLKLSGLGLIDNILGLIVGSMKVFLIFSIILFAISKVETIKTTTDKFFSNSFMYPIFLETGGLIVKLDENDIGELENKVQKNISNIKIDSFIPEPKKEEQEEVQ